MLIPKICVWNLVTPDSAGPPVDTCFWYVKREWRNLSNYNNNHSNNNNNNSLYYSTHGTIPRKLERFCSTTITTAATTRTIHSVRRNEESIALILTALISSCPGTFAGDTQNSTNNNCNDYGNKEVCHNTHARSTHQNFPEGARGQWKRTWQGRVEMSRVGN